MCVWEIKQWRWQREYRAAHLNHSTHTHTHTHNTIHPIRQHRSNPQTNPVNTVYTVPIDPYVTQMFLIRENTVSRGRPVIHIVSYNSIMLVCEYTLHSKFKNRELSAWDLWQYSHIQLKEIYSHIIAMHCNDLTLCIISPNVQPIQQQCWQMTCLSLEDKTRTVLLFWNILIVKGSREKSKTNNDLF